MARQRQFHAIMEIAQDVEQIDPRGLVELVRLCGFVIVAQFFAWRIRSRSERPPQLTRPDYLFMPTGTKIDEAGRTVFNLCPETKGRSRLRLGRDLILPFPWNRSRLAKSLALIGPGRDWGKWKRDGENHLIEMWKPLGIGWVWNGNHSITAGIIRNEGFLKPHVVRDITPLYDYVECDGIAFIRKSDRTRLSPAYSPEFAAIFEMGRMMVRHGVSA